MPERADPAPRATIRPMTPPPLAPLRRAARSLLGPLVAWAGAAHRSDGQPDRRPPAVAAQRAIGVAPSAPGSPTPDPATRLRPDRSAVGSDPRAPRPRRPVEPTLLDEATLKQNTATSFDKDNPPELVAANQRLYELLGLSRPATSRDLYAQAPGQPGRRPLRPRRPRSCTSCRRSGGLGADREVHLRPRVRPRPPGPELRPDDSSPTSIGRATVARPPGASPRATRRC